MNSFDLKLMKKYAIIFLLLTALVISIQTDLVFASEADDRYDDDSKDDDSKDDDRYDDDSKDDDRYDDDSKDERENYREERKKYKESKVCTNEGECVEDEEFKEAREAYKQEREEHRSDKQASSENKQQVKKYAKMLQILGNVKFGDDFVLPPRIQMLLVEDYNEI